MSIGGGSSRGNSSSGLQTQSFAGSYGAKTKNALGQEEGSYEDSRRLSQMTEDTIGKRSAFATPLEQMLLNPQYGAGNQNETNLINSLLDATAGRTATRGLGAPTQNSMTASIAPTLVDLRQKEIQNLIGGEQSFQQGRQLDLQSLLEMIGYAMPQIVSGNASQSSDRGFNFGISAGKK